MNVGKRLWHLNLLSPFQLKKIHKKGHVVGKSHDTFKGRNELNPKKRTQPKNHSEWEESVSTRGFGLNRGERFLRFFFVG